MEAEKLYRRVVTWEDLPSEQARPGVVRKGYATNTIQLVMNICDKGMDLRPHKHDDFDQLACILKGRAIYYVDGVGHEMGPGSMLLVPAGSMHYIEPAEDGVQNLDIFAPPRADLLHLTKTFLKDLA